MKKSFKYIVSILVIVFITLSAIFFITKNKMNAVNLSYKAIEGKKFVYSIKDNNLNCKLDKDTRLKNLDKVKLECSDPTFNFIKFDKEYTITGLYSDNLDTNKKFIAVENLIFPFENYLYKKTDEGIEVIRIASENNKYFTDTYFNLFFDDENLVKLDDFSKLKIASKYKHITPGAKVSNIERKYIDEIIQKYIDSGYTLKFEKEQKKI